MLLHHLLLTPLLNDDSDGTGGDGYYKDEYSSGSGSGDFGPPLPDGGVSYPDGTTIYPDGSSEGYGPDGSYWYQGANGDSYYQDADGTSYYSDANGNWFDQNGEPVKQGSSIWSKIGNALKNAVGSSGSGSGGGPGVGSGVARGVGNAATAAGNNRLTQERLALDQERINQTGVNDFESQLMARAREEQALKSATFSNIDSTASLEGLQNRVQNPRVSPFDPTGGPKYSDQYKGQLATDVSMAEKTLQTPNQYGASGWPAMTKFNPIDFTKLQEATGTQPGTLENVGNVAGYLLPWLDFFLPHNQQEKA